MDSEIVENARLKGENEELISKCTAHESSFHRLEKRYEALKLKLSRRKMLYDVIMAHNSEEELCFKNFFKVVEGSECECLDENTMYDAFFSSIPFQHDRERFIEWMYACCHQGAHLPKKQRLKIAHTEARVGKRMFAACLWAIGGIFKRAYRGNRNVWINIHMCIEKNKNENSTFIPLKKRRQEESKDI